jgi:hypothetical protein
VLLEPGLLAVFAYARLVVELVLQMDRLPVPPQMDRLLGVLLRAQRSRQRRRDLGCPVLGHSD